MRAGRLRQRINVQKVTETRGAHGSVTRTWNTVASRWASVEPLRGREYMEAAQATSNVTHRVRMRFYSGLNTKSYRFQFTNPPDSERTLNIDSVLNLDERNREHECMCIEDA